MDYSFMSPENRKRITSAYEASENKIEELSADRLVKSIDWRLYTEFCLNEHFSKHRGYSGEAFTQWVDDETHYEMIRQGLEWNEEARRFEDGSGAEEAKAKTRERVFVALTERAIDFFKDCDEFRGPKKRIEGI